MLIYGMGEKPVKELVKLLKKGIPFDSLNNNTPDCDMHIVPDLSYQKTKAGRQLILHSYKEVTEDKINFLRAFVEFEKESNKIDAAQAGTETR